MPWHESVIEAELAKTDVLVNATAIGLHGDETPVPAELLPPDLLVLDLIYRSARPLLRDASLAGATVLNGELMLLHQGAAAFTLWTGQPAPLELMQKALEEAEPAASCRPKRATGRPSAPDARLRDHRVGRIRLLDRRRIARPGARRDPRGPAGRAAADAPTSSRPTSPAASAATAAAPARPSSTTGPRSSPASGTA